MPESGFWHPSLDRPADAPGQCGVTSIRQVRARSFSTHQAKSSNAELSNSKLLKDFLEGRPALTLLGFDETSLHRFALDQICSFPFGFDLALQSDGHNYTDRLALLIGDVLDTAI
jgi:hypothetical protein